MGTAQVRHEEKRRYPRYSCDLGVEVRVGDAKSDYWGTLADLCLGGCYVSSFSPLTVGTSIVLVIRNENLEINISGTVVTSHPGVGMGVQFSGFGNPNGETQLKELVGQLAKSAEAI